MKEKVLALVLSFAALSFASCAAVPLDSPAENEPQTAILREGETEPDMNGSEMEDAATSSGTDDVSWTENNENAVPELDENGTYNSKEDVSLYLHLYDHLPSNYITKSEARSLGWSGGPVESYAPEGTAIGGDSFGNREGLLPAADGRSYYECDIDTVGETSRGAKRIIYSNDGLIYYTDDHYASFTLLYGEEEA